MKIAAISCREIDSRAALHSALRDALSLPEYYGNNLDALSDCLTDLSEDMLFIVRDFSFLEETLGEYARRFRLVLQNCAADNGHLNLMITESAH